MYIYIYIDMDKDRDVCTCTCVYTYYIFTYICLCVHTYIYMHKEINASYTLHLNARDPGRVLAVLDPSRDEEVLSCSRVQYGALLDKQRPKDNFSVRTSYTSPNSYE